MHNEAAVHKDEWEDFFQHHNTLCTNNSGKIGKTESSIHFYPHQNQSGKGKVTQGQAIG
ncbi:uncharacterized protein ACA1_092230 [Acanthamoeba castellanii str. Neff]|uniref:Uncharacterized protein n=1 Tax=Acanthamoeba castellanii (strain ATCC 30010 / Neff) TaxID=1257118 RepID=L8GIY4_ACACF|nr:uncharacterized protein ACA1_092230 [Acanthamoeba castellanii str. Neff]ELR12713.1 hypothetical protein ACA1_092230 [Acanthamoeba castellanii str. Neff]